jgi:hypothetical protein
VDLDRARLERVVEAIAERLPGDWLLVGGALVALWLEPRRTTEDVGHRRARRHDRRLAGRAGAIPERYPGRIHRPSVTLFLLLKLGRLSEQDLADCLAALARATSDGLRFDAGRVLAALDALPAGADAELAHRRRRLRDAVTAAR